MLILPDELRRALAAHGDLAAADGLRNGYLLTTLRGVPHRKVRMT